jgi:hypothetical protein
MRGGKRFTCPQQAWGLFSEARAFREPSLPLQSESSKKFDDLVKKLSPSSNHMSLTGQSCPIHPLSKYSIGLKKTKQEARALKYPVSNTFSKQMLYKH